MSTKITPTVGRVVWFYPSIRTGSSDFSPPAAGQPLAAIVAAVLASSGVDIVNLAVFDAVGELHPETMVPLFQDGQDLPEDGFYATWMPYQVEQAKKAEAREHDAKQLAVAADRDADARRMRAGVLDMALRTPGLQDHDGVLRAAAAYQAHIEGEAPAQPPQPLVAGAGQQTAEPGPKATPPRGDFGFALAWLKAGARVARAGWNGKGMFVYLVPANAYPAQTGAAKAHFGEGALVPYNAYLALKGADDTVSTWAPSGSDALAEDWLIVE